MSRKIAILADIHGNVPALQATLSDIKAQQVDEVLVGGDLVGRGPQGSEVTKTIRERGWSCVRGNHEDYLLSFRRGEVPADWHEGSQWSALRWMAAELSEQDISYIETLPFSVASPAVSGLRLVHGSPTSHCEGLAPWSTDEELERHLAGLGECLLVCAHTHRPMCRRVRGGLVVNVGAVGLPFNGDRRAQYAILHHNGGDWQVEFRQVQYDLDRILAIYESSGFLAAGGVTAQLLRLELEHSAPFLVPFLKWAAARNLPAEAAQIESFLEFHNKKRSAGGPSSAAPPRSP